jgi:hypothetical protein
LPRRSARTASVEVVCQPALSPTSSIQQMTAVLNGSLVGTVMLPPGWNQTSLAAPAQTWRIGVNELELFLSSSESPGDAGLNNDQRRLSVAIDRVTVRASP